MSGSSTKWIARGVWALAQKLDAMHHYNCDVVTGRGPCNCAMARPEEHRHTDECDPSNCDISSEEWHARHPNQTDGGVRWDTMRWSPTETSDANLKIMWEHADEMSAVVARVHLRRLIISIIAERAEDEERHHGTA